MKFGEQVYYEPVKSGLKVKSDQKHILDTASFELLVVNQTATQQFDTPQILESLLSLLMSMSN